MEKIPEELSSTTPTPADQPRLVRPSSGRIWFMAVVFLLPLLIMIIFAIVFVTMGLQTQGLCA